MDYNYHKKYAEENRARINLNRRKRYSKQKNYIKSLEKENESLKAIINEFREVGVITKDDLKSLIKKNETLTKANRHLRYLAREKSSRLGFKDIRKIIFE